MRDVFRDDAFIHLRYAENLAAHGLLTYDGTTRSQGTSSLLFTTALAAASALRHSYHWAKVVAVAGYAVLGAWTWRVRRELGSWAVPFAVVLATPMAIRTLTDGTETSWSVVAAVFLASAASTPAPASWSRRCGLLLLGAACALLRLDLGVLVAVMAVAELARRRRPGAWPWVGAGFALGAAATVALAGHLLSDGAIAKPPLWLGFGGRLWRAALAHAASLSFGAGLLALVGAASARLLGGAAGRDERRAAALVTFVPPAFWAVAAGLGVVAFGLRYAIPGYVFAFFWCALARRPLAGEPGFRRSAVAAVFVLVAASWVVELATLTPVVRSQRTRLAAFEAAHLESLEGQTGLAYQVGEIGYFTRAYICDLGGLVSGREMARLSAHERLAACLARHPGFAYLSEPQLEAMLPLATWTDCGAFEVVNLERPDRLHLRVRPDVGCAAR
jgi:hypothetical protein